MDELTAIRRFREDVVVPNEGRGRALAQLQAAILAKPRRALHRRPLVLVFVAAAAVILAGAAFALAHLIAVGDPAPADVKAEAARLGAVRGILLRPETDLQPPPMNIDALHAGAVLNASTGPIYLWVAEAGAGQRTCAYLDVTGTETPAGKPNLSGGCMAGGRPLQLSRTTSTLHSGQTVSVISGVVQPSKVARLAVTVASKTSPIPLSGRFFLFELASQDRSRSAVVTAFDKSGRVVSRVVLPGASTRPLHPSLDVSGRKPLIEIRTRYTHKPIRLYVFDQNGERCQVLQTPGGGEGGGCATAKIHPRRIAVGSTQIGGASTGLLLLSGEVGSEVASLELRFQNGRIEHLPLTDGWTLYQVARDSYGPGRQPIEFIGRNQNRAIIARKAVR